MAKRQTRFIADTGEAFEVEHDAWRCDLDNWLKISGIDNAALRTAVAKAICDDIANGNHLTAIVKGLKDSAPERVIAGMPAKVAA